MGEPDLQSGLYPPLPQLALRTLEENPFCLSRQEKEKKITPWENMNKELKPVALPPSLASFR